MLLIIGLSILTFSSWGQRRDSVRDKYIERFPDYFFIWPVLKQRSTAIEIEPNNNRSKLLTFKPNNSYGAGFGLYLFEVGAEITFSVPINQKKNDLYGSSTALDLQANLLGKNWGADIFYQKYAGFYAIDANKVVPSNTPYPQRPDLATRNFGLNGIYIFNKYKFSLRSAYNFAERQRKSAGSFLLTGTINSYHLQADSALYGKAYEPVFGKSAQVDDFQSFTVSVAPGYTYTAVLLNFFLNASLSVGPAFRQIDYRVNDVGYSSAGVNGFTDIRVGMGYNGERFFSGLSYVTQSRSVKLDEVKITAINSTFKLLVGYRFREVGILKKRALDLLPHAGSKN